MTQSSSRARAGSPQPPFELRKGTRFDRLQDCFAHAVKYVEPEGHSLRRTKYEYGVSLQIECYRGRDQEHAGPNIVPNCPFLLIARPAQADGDGGPTKFEVRRFASHDAPASRPQGRNETRTSMRKPRLAYAEPDTDASDAPTYNSTVLFDWNDSPHRNVPAQVDKAKARLRDSTLIDDAEQTNGDDSRTRGTNLRTRASTDDDWNRPFDTRDQDRPVSSVTPSYRHDCQPVDARNQPPRPHSQSSRLDRGDDHGFSSTSRRFKQEQKSGSYTMNLGKASRWGINRPAPALEHVKSSNHKLPPKPGVAWHWRYDSRDGKGSFYSQELAAHRHVRHDDGGNESDVCPDRNERDEHRDGRRRRKRSRHEADGESDSKSDRSPQQQQTSNDPTETASSSRLSKKVRSESQEVDRAWQRGSAKGAASSTAPARPRLELIQLWEELVKDSLALPQANKSPHAQSTSAPESSRAQVSSAAVTTKNDAGADEWESPDDL
ncbi:hypothetical protein ACM66B_002700 [Microbotryomycetes sp. NB124-2]